ncbi:Fc receptor-like protein 2 isoform X3 [Mobula birostris]|uniref:Fc receptor-like protein 2 isoform X3 n=1 Tax=Mobula birostris TaxID=1983395 RepID=UPI003B27F5B0
MWISVLLISFLPVSGAFWAEKYIRGVVGRTVTIDCHYEAMYLFHTKFWCIGFNHPCSTVVETHGHPERSERVSITDNRILGVFTVTMEDLHPGDTGWYSCGITTSGNNPLFGVYLLVSDEPVSVPVLGFLSPANVSRLGGSVTVSCESVQGSLPIQYTWYENNSSGHSKISDTNKLDLHCQSFKHQRHQYYCTASNWHGAKSSEMVNVTIFNNGENCSYVTEINGTKPVSVPVLGFLSAPNDSHLADSASMSCESVQGSLPIQYSWYEKTPSMDSKISNTNELDLHCQPFKHQLYQYYCKATNILGTKSSEMVNISIYNRGGKYKYLMELSHGGREYSCETFTTASTASFMIWKVGRWVLFALLMISTISVMWFTRETKLIGEAQPTSEYIGKGILAQESRIHHQGPPPSRHALFLVLPMERRYRSLRSHTTRFSNNSAIRLLNQHGLIPLTSTLK